MVLLPLASLLKLDEHGFNKLIDYAFVLDTSENMTLAMTPSCLVQPAETPHCLERVLFVTPPIFVTSPILHTRSPRLKLSFLSLALNLRAELRILTSVIFFSSFLHL